MIRAFADGKPPIHIFGLSAENIRRLTDYAPMVFDANDMRFVIIYGETEDALADELKKTGLIDVTIDTRRGPYE